jgi:hypothetical protein
MGTVTVGKSGTASLELREVGSANLEVSDPTISGADAASFRVEEPASFPITIADGADAVTLAIVCTPQRDGTHSATLTLTTNDAEQPTVSYPLTCTGEVDQTGGGNNSPTLASTFTSKLQTRSAMLHASVNPNGLPTTVSFAWGTTANGPYPNEQDTTDVISGTQVQTASLSLSDLMPNTTYYYIVTATNADGSVTSSEQSFTTPAITGSPAYGSTPEAGSTLDMGTVTVGKSGTASLELREVGSANLEVSDPAISGADAASFRVEEPASFPITIADGADAVTLSVVCTPQRDGTHSATLTLTTSDTELPTVSYPLACTGEASEPVDTSTVLYLPLIAR